MNAPKQIESQVQHILRNYEDVALEEKIIDLCLEWLSKGIVEGVRAEREVFKNKSEEKMDRFERYAIAHYLSQWPEELTTAHPNETGFDLIIDALQNDDESLDITVCEVYELYTGEDVAAMIMDMRDSLRRVFNE